MATFTIFIASLLFVWLGTKTMLLAHQLQAHSYEDLNLYLFGQKVGPWINALTFFILFGITSVMLAGAGAIFHEQLHLSYQFGLLFTVLLTYTVLLRGVEAILVVNTIVVPFIIALTIIIVHTALHSAHPDNWLQLSSSYSPFKIWLAPLLYTAFNLALAQAVLVPIGSTIKEKRVLLWGGIIGGCGIGLMLLAGHFALSSQMPAVIHVEIPMGMLLGGLGKGVQLLFVLVIFAEIFTTFIADVYGLARQLEQRMKLDQRVIIIAILIVSYAVSQIGFKTLLSTLYPLFGAISLGWLFMMLRRKNRV